jgi:hypothetical protein
MIKPVAPSRLSFSRCNRSVILNLELAQFSGLTLHGDSGEEVALVKLTLLLHWSKAKWKSPCNFE